MAYGDVTSAAYDDQPTQYDTNIPTMSGLQMGAGVSGVPGAVTFTDPTTGKTYTGYKQNDPNAEGLSPDAWNLTGNGAGQGILHSASSQRDLGTINANPQGQYTAPDGSSYYLTDPSSSSSYTSTAPPKDDTGFMSNVVGPIANFAGQAAAMYGGVSGLGGLSNMFSPTAMPGASSINPFTGTPATTAAAAAPGVTNTTQSSVNPTPQAVGGWSSDPAITAGTGANDWSTLNGMAAPGTGTGTEAGVNFLGQQSAAQAGTLGAGSVSAGDGLGSLIGSGGGAADYLGTGQLGNLAGAAGTTGASTGGLSGLLQSLNSGLSDFSTSIGMGANPITMGDVGKAGANYFLQDMLAKKYSNAATANMNAGSVLNQPQRQQYQTQLSNLLSNPADFYSTNPVVQGQMNLAKQQFQANSAKMGTGGTQFNDYLTNLQNVASGTFNSQANLLSGLGGFNQGTGSTAGGAQLMSQGIGASNLGNIGIGNNIFKQQGPVQGQTGQSLLNPGTTNT